MSTSGLLDPADSIGGTKSFGARQYYGDNSSKSSFDRSLSNHQRVILLLDMDCFYAQCETVRLGLDQKIPLALVQWSSALAVNYPARTFGIKRGDSFEVIREKSEGSCVAIHLPVTPVSSVLSSPSKSTLHLSSPSNCSLKSPSVPKNKNQEIGSSLPQNYTQSTPTGQKPQHHNEHCSVENDCKGYESSEGDHQNEDLHSSQAAYDAEFNKPQSVREMMYKLEKNKMRSPQEGKACLDRYRLASSRIFSLINETLEEMLGKKKFILERASIDELFIDVTPFCFKYSLSNVNNSESNTEKNGMKHENPSIASQFRLHCHRGIDESLKETTICHAAKVDLVERTHEIGRALRMGCHIAWTVRNTVFRELGFTLSAGISTSKLVAKLGASYGKPNGQAVIFPSAIPEVMEETQIRKARMLGGKLGKKVLDLLPQSETSMGSIARLLTLDDLIQAIGEQSGRWVFDACRGICREEVKPTLNVLPKSITSFKSFGKLSYPELDKWTSLLASDIMRRVENDTKRNNRAPKSISVGYTMTPGGAWIGRTFRLTFPSDKDFDCRVKRLVDDTRNVLIERGHFPIIRIGFSAIDFVVRPKTAIDSFFTPGNVSNSTSSSAKRINIVKENELRPGTLDSFFKTKVECTPNPEKAPTSQRAFEKQKPKIDSQRQTHQLLESHHVANSVSIPNKYIADSSSPKKNLIEPDDDTEPTRKTAAKTVTADEELARMLQKRYDNECLDRLAANKSSSGEEATSTLDCKLSKDEMVALQLQNAYDREESVLSEFRDRFSSVTRKRTNANQKTTKKIKTCKIDCFLRKR